MSGPVVGARWREYRRFLRAALDAGYDVVSLDDWVGGAGAGARRCLILRHDVDQRPAAALTMAQIERDLGLRSTWYLRWRTAHPRVVAGLKLRGMVVGLHYETLTRLVRAARRTHADAALVAAARAALGDEIAAFAARFGPIRTICPHGDSRLPGVRNLDLVRGHDVTRLGVEYDGNEVLRGVPLRWLTDRRSARRWKDGQQPRELFAAGVSPILAVVHPNHWTSRGALAVDRVCSRLLPDPLARSAAWPPIASRSELPPAA